MRQTILDAIHSFNSSQPWWLRQAHVPVALIADRTLPAQTREDFCLVDLAIAHGTITRIQLADPDPSNQEPGIDLKRKIILPRMVDLHTHLDKGHIWERSPNPSGTFDGAITTVEADKDHWQREDIYRRMEFGLQCSYVHGSSAVRTHLDSAGELAAISFEVFNQLKQEWCDRLTMQAVSLVTLDYFLTPAGVTLADLVAEQDGILGGVAFMNPDLDQQLDAVFQLAIARGLDLDFHADENNDPSSICLQKIARAALRHNFAGQIICGHCCSLAVQPAYVVTKTLELVKAAGIGVVSLPMCNLYLQDRKAQLTPQWRGVTLVHELQAQGTPIAFASDNCRDPFHGFGDHDMLDVFNQAVRIAHLDNHYGNWCTSVTQTPADLMGLPDVGRLGVGLPADLIIFNARYFSELLSRHQSDRLVLHRGQPVTDTLPDYAELDPLVLG